MHSARWLASGNLVVMNSKVSHALAIIVACLVCCLAIRIVFIEAPLESDDTTYMQLAELYSKPLLRNFDYQLPFRTGLIIPIRCAIELFGYSIVSYYVVSFLFYAAMIVAVCLLSKRISGYRMVLYSCAIVFSSPLVLFQTSNVLPDVPFVAFYLLSFYGFTISVEKQTGKSCVLFLFLSALLGFIAYTVRLPNVVMLVGIPVYEFLRNRSLRKSFRYGMILVVLIGVEMAFFFWMTGDPFVRIRKIAGGVSIWTVHMNGLSLTQFLLDPLINYTQWKSGWLFLVGGIGGSICAVGRRNYAVVSLGISGLAIFVLYSYSVTSVDPLVRAMPLQLRYVVGASVVFGILTAYLFDSILVRLECLSGSRFAYGFSAIVMGAVLFLIFVSQLTGLRKSISGSVLFGNDHYFVMDRMVREFIKRNQLNGKLWALPGKDFRLYPSISELELFHFGYDQTLKPGDYLLYSRKQVRSDVVYSRNPVPKDFAERALGLPLDWDYLLDTGQLALVRITDRKVENVSLADLSRGTGGSEIWFPSHSVVDNRDSGIVFGLKSSGKPYYIQTIDGSFMSPPGDFPWNIDVVSGSDALRVSLDYSLSESIRGLGLFVCQYSDTKRIDVSQWNLNPKSGQHSGSFTVKTLPDTSTFRVLLRIDASIDSMLELNSMGVDALYSE